LWRGHGSGGLGSATDLCRFYRNDGWSIHALAAGNFDGSGQDELLSAFKSDGGTTKIYRGNGRTGVGSSIYSSTYWDIHAMTAEDVDGDGTSRLVTAFFHPTSSGGELRIYTGNGTTS